jgi:hypothetical protein
MTSTIFTSNWIIGGTVAVRDIYGGTQTVQVDPIPLKLRSQTPVEPGNIPTFIEGFYGLWSYIVD